MRMFRSSLFFLSFFLLLNSLCDAQIDTVLPVKVQPDNRSDLEKLELLVDKHIMINKAKKTVPGYRIQIYYGSKRAEALEAKSLFQSENSELPTYLIYQQPYFKVRVGDFYSRLEALKHFQQITLDFDNAFIVKDDIRIRGLEEKEE